MFWFLIPKVKEITMFRIWLEKLSFEQFARKVKMATLEISDNEGIEYFHYFSVDFVNSSQCQSESTNTWYLGWIYCSKFKVKHATCAN